MKWLKDKRIVSILWAILRIWLGYTWLHAGLVKTQNSSWFGAEAGSALAGFLQGAIGKATGDHPAVQQWFASFLSTIALPNAVFFSYLVVFGEILVGIGLITGTFTVISLLVSAFMNLNYMLAGASGLNPNMFVVAFVLLYVGSNAYFYGLDQWLLSKNCQLWNWLKKNDKNLINS